MFCELLSNWCPRHRGMPPRKTYEELESYSLRAASQAFGAIHEIGNSTTEGSLRRRRRSTVDNRMLRRKRGGAGRMTRPYLGDRESRGPVKWGTSRQTACVPVKEDCDAPAPASVVHLEASGILAGTAGYGVGGLSSYEKAGV